MKYHPDYPSINQVESFLISQKAPTKLLSQTKCLVQSKHTVDSITSSFKMPSDQCLQKISKIFPYQVRSTGSDTNSNIRCIITVALQIAYSSYDEQLQNIFLQKIQNESENQRFFTQLKNNHHESVTYSNIIKVITGFLKTIKNKKLKNPEQFDLIDQIENLPIILDYLIIVARTILTRLSIQNAEDFNKQVKDKDCFDIITDYFDLNFIKKQFYYFFQDSSYFVYKNQNEYLFGKYGQAQNAKRKLSNQKVTQIKHNNKYEKDYNLKILECSMQSGSNLLSSRHADQSTPCFTNVEGENFMFKANFKAKEQQQFIFEPNSSQKNNDRNFDSKGVDSISSGIEVNVYSQASHKSFNTKYKNIQQLKDSNQIQSLKNHQMQLGFRSSPSKNVNQKTNNYAKSQNNAGSFKKMQKFKNQTNNPKSAYSQLKRAKSDQCTQQILKFNSHENVSHQNTCDQIKNNKNQQNQKFDKIFEWQNNQRRLRRVQTICYKTCSTCNRRFYKNQIRSNIINIKIEAKKFQKPVENQIKKIHYPISKQLKKFQKFEEHNPKKNQNAITQNPLNNNNSLKFQIKRHQEFLNKKFHKKSADTVLQLNKIKTQGNQEKTSLKQIEKNNINPKTNNFEWIKNMMNNKEDALKKQRSITSPQTTPITSPLYRDYQKDIWNNNNFVVQSLSSKNIEAIHSKNILGTRKSIKQDEIPTNQKSQDKKSIKIQIQTNNKPVQSIQVSPKNKTFLSFKSQKDFKRIQPTNNIQFRKKVQKPIQLKNSNKLQQTNLTKIQNFKMKGSLSGNLDITKATQIKKSQNIVQLSKSAQKKVPNFIRKDSLKNNLIKDFIN